MNRPNCNSEMVTAHRGNPQRDPTTGDLDYKNVIFGDKCYSCGMFEEMRE